MKEGGCEGTRHQLSIINHTREAALFSAHRHLSYRLQRRRTPLRTEEQPPNPRSPAGRTLCHAADGGLPVRARDRKGSDKEQQRGARWPASLEVWNELDEITLFDFFRLTFSRRIYLLFLKQKIIPFDLFQLTFSHRIYLLFLKQKIIPRSVDRNPNRNRTNYLESCEN